METVKNIFVQVIEKPERKVLIKRGIKAADYFAYCEEVGCDVWRLLTSIKSMGVEVPTTYDGIVPEGFDTITLPAARYLMFQCEPFA